MSNSTKIYWGRVLLGGLLAELLVFAIVFPVRHFVGQRAFLASIPIASAAMPMFLPFGWLDELSHASCCTAHL